MVNIYANKMTTVRQYRIVPDPVTRRLFGAIAAGPSYKKQEQSLGSGVVFSADGYVLTNNHVINGADDIQVLLFDGRVAQARVIGADADTDLAVLKIDAADLPTIAVADRGDVNVGDVVLAIGNPFGVGKTVTMGIVSATGRQLRLSAYEDFIQTDAAINFGNSGGALVNALGELVGINTAVYRNAGGDGRQGAGQQNAEGIGFAIPVATAKAVLDQIISHGMVIRGWFGAEYADPSACSIRRGRRARRSSVGWSCSKCCRVDPPTAPDCAAVTSCSSSMARTSSTRPTCAATKRRWRRARSRASTASATACRFRST